MLTKTAYLAYTQCPKQFWLDAYQPELAAPPDPTAQRRLRAGQDVDRLAREQFPNGRIIPLTSPQDEMTRVINKIRQLAQGGVPWRDILLIHASREEIGPILTRVNRAFGWEQPALSASKLPLTPARPIPKTRFASAPSTPPPAWKAQSSS